MDTDMPDDGWMPTFYVGQHESRRSLPITDQVLRQAQDCNYDMLTTPITNDMFHARVLTISALHTSRCSSVASVSGHDDAHLAPKIPALSSADTNLSPSPIASQLLAMISSWIDLCSPDPIIYDLSRQVLCLEAAYAAFCGIEYIFVPGPLLYHDEVRTHGLSRYARAIQEALAIGNHLQVHIMMPMVDHPDDSKQFEIDHLARDTRPEFSEEYEESRPKKVDVFGTWDAWNLIRTVCKYSNRLFVALSIPRHLPPLAIQSRWYSEPVRVLSLHLSTFPPNSKGYPTLYPPIQSFISRMMRIKTPPWILLCDVGPIPGLDNRDQIISMSDGFLSPGTVEDASLDSPTPAEAKKLRHQGGGKSESKKKDPTSHLSYIRYLQRRQPPQSVVEKYGAGYQDYLQVPLQPLTDNLESVTYEVFEKDPVKYDLYEKAIRKALRDWVEEGKPTSNPEGRIVVAVAGAGRGPLVTRALRASEAEGVDIEIWAVEKNPNAYVLLQKHNVEDWKSRVTVVQSDMRSWKGPWREAAVSPPLAAFSTDPMKTLESQDDTEELYHGSTESASTPPIVFPPPSTPHVNHIPIDILISELLGSFADNELSPECLDGILHLLNPIHGISIPSSYTAYLTPIAAPKIHADISSRAVYDSTAYETPAVVWLHAIDYLSLLTPTILSASDVPQASSRKDKQGATSPVLDPSHTNDPDSLENVSEQGKQRAAIKTIPDPPLSVPSDPPKFSSKKGKERAASPRLDPRSTTTSDPPNPTSQTTPKPTVNPPHPPPSTNPTPSSSSSNPHPLVLPAWTFTHTPSSSPPLSPSPFSNSASNSNTHNTRYTSLTFPIPNRSVCHGLAGYFEATLYGPVTLSTNPNTMDHMSNGMISWFPIFFPLRSPVYVPDGAALGVSMWRMTDGRKVWYEWGVESWGPKEKGKGGGRVRLGVGEWMSSYKGGCLM